MKRILDMISNIYMYIALLCMIALISILTIEICLRYFFSQSMDWSQELFTILICWITFLGFGKLVVDREDITITFLVERLSEGKQRIMMIINSILLLVVSSIMLIVSTKLTISHMEKRTIIMKAASAWFYTPLVLLLILVVLTSIYHVVLAFKSQLLIKTEEGVE